MPLKQELPGVGENMQEHIIDNLTCGMPLLIADIVCVYFTYNRLVLKDDFDALTFDALRDPKRLAEETEL